MRLFLSTLVGLGLLAPTTFALTVTPSAPAARGRLVVTGSLSVDSQWKITLDRHGKTNVETRLITQRDDIFHACNLETTGANIDENFDGCVDGHINQAIALEPGEYEIFFNNSRSVTTIISGQTRVIPLNKVMATMIPGSVSVELSVDYDCNRSAYEYDEDYSVGTFAPEGDRQRCKEEVKVDPLAFPFSSPVYKTPVCKSQTVKYASAQAYFLVLPGCYGLHWSMSKDGDVNKGGIEVR